MQTKKINSINNKKIIIVLCIIFVICLAFVNLTCTIGAVIILTLGFKFDTNKNVSFRPSWLFIGGLCLFSGLFFQNSNNEQTNSTTKPKQTITRDISGLYIVHESNDGKYIANVFIGCKTQESLQKYKDSSLGDSETNYIPKLFASGDCISLDNRWNTRYSIRVDDVQNNIIREITRISFDGEENKFYTYFEISENIAFDQDPYGQEARLERDDRIKTFFSSEINSIKTTEVAAYLCKSSNDFNKLFFSRINFDKGLPNTVLNGKCLKIKSGTQIKRIDIDRDNLWVKYEILNGEHSGELLWGAP